MKKNTKIAIGAVIAVVMVVGFAFIIKAGIHKMAVEKAQNVVIATVTGEDITKKDFDIRKESIFLNDVKMGDREILSRMTVQKAVYLDALKNKVAVDANGLQKMIIEQQKKMKNSAKYQVLKTDLKRLEISEKDYWDGEAKRLKENATRDQYKIILKKEFVKANKDTDKSVVEKEFDELYNKATADAIFAADIKILVEYK